MVKNEIFIMIMLSVVSFKVMFKMIEEVGIKIEEFLISEMVEVFEEVVMVNGIVLMMLKGSYMVSGGDGVIGSVMLV